MSSHEKRQELTFKHFSHTHDLQLSNYDDPKTSFCAACQTKASGWICSCRSCSFVLHFQCSIAPQKLHLPFHRTHALSLVPKQVLFKCQACAGQGINFSYSCMDCNVHLHFDCARTPLVLTYPFHHHPLDLVRSPSVIQMTDNCKVCNIPVSNCWYYECFKCNFYAHLDCAKSNKNLDSSSQISSKSTTSMAHKESNNNTNSSIEPKVKKSSVETSYKGKGKGSNSRNQDDKPYGGNRFGNMNYSNGNSYGGVKEGNRNKQNYESTKNTRGGGRSGHKQPQVIDNTNQYAGDSFNDRQPRFGNRKNVEPVNFGGRNSYGTNRIKLNNDSAKHSGGGWGGGYGGGYGSNDIQDNDTDYGSDHETNYGSDDEFSNDW